MTFDFKKAMAFVQTKLNKASGYPHDLYQYQTFALIETLSSFESGQFDNVIIVAPTGSGKSSIAVGLGLAAAEQNHQTMLLTPTRQLQKQAVDSFKTVKELRSFKGKANYGCPLFLTPTGQIADATTAPCAEYDVDVDPEENTRPHYHLETHPIKTDHPDLDKIVMKTVAGYDSSFHDITKSQHQAAVCTEEGICPYRLARDIASASPIAIMNSSGYMVWNVYARETPYFKPRPFTIFDECHTVEDIARGFYTMEASDQSLNKLYQAVLGLDKPPVDFSKGANIQHLTQLNTKALIASMKNNGMEGKFSEYAELAEEAGDRSNPAKLIKYYKLLKLVADKQNRYAAQVRPGNVLTVTPIDLPVSFKEIYGTYNVFMSATVADVDVFCQSMHLDRKRTKFFQLPDMFPVEHRPIVGIPVAAVTKKEIDKDPAGIYELLAEKLDEIAEAFPEHKIMVHTSSYAFGQDILGRVGMHTYKRMLCPRNGFENKEAIELYVRDGAPSILISPACREGYDFEGDLCRIQVFMKCPFPSMGDEVIRQKAAGRGGKAWYAAKVATAIRQMYGRSTRNAKDFSITFFLDSKIIEFVQKNARLFPAEFHRAMDLGRTFDWKELEITDELSIDGERLSL